MTAIAICPRTWTARSREPCAASAHSAAPEVSGPGRNGAGAWTLVDILEQAPLKRARLRRQTKRRETLHDAGQPEVIVIRRPQPDARASGEARVVDLDATVAPSQAVEQQHAIEGLAKPRAQCGIPFERGDGRVGDERRRRIHGAWLPRRKQPLDVVVHLFEPLVVPPENPSQRPAAAIRLPGIERNDGLHAWIIGAGAGSTVRARPLLR
jgi:hypothetical protein